MGFFKRLLSMAMYLTLFFTVVFLFLFFTNNTERVGFQIPGLEAQYLPLHIICLAFLAIGYFTSSLVNSAGSMRRYFEMKRMKKEIETFRLEKQRSKSIQVDHQKSPPLTTEI